jgi:hypothetical protein
MMLSDVACFAMINRFDNNWIDIVISLVFNGKFTFRIKVDQW